MINKHLKTETEKPVLYLLKKENIKQYLLKISKLQTLHLASFQI